MGGISVWQLLILLAIVLLLFGAKKLRNVGGDLGSAIKGFRSAMKDGEAEESNAKNTANQTLDQKDTSSVIDVEVSREQAKPKDKDAV